MAYAVAKDAPVSLPAPPGSRKDPTMQQDRADASGIRRTVLGTKPIDALPGWELRLLLVEYAPGVASDPHTHPVPGIGYVLEGSFESAWGEANAAPSLARKGEAFADRANERHFFRNASSTEPLRFVIAYAIPIGTPGLTPA
jgi:quercetin dioxygenase-like cupin family protein